MRNLLWTATAVLVMLSIGHKAQAQVMIGAPTVTPKTEANPPPLPATPPPAGKANVYAEGTYTIPGTAKLSKIEAKWYKQDGQNLIFVGSNTALLPNNPPATGNYKTQLTPVDLKDNNQNFLKYTVIVIVYVEANPATDPPVQSGPSGIATDYKP